jgi:hypothetical protein
MKNLLLTLLMMFLSFVSYAQEEKYKLKKIKTISYVKEYIGNATEYEHWNSISLGVSSYGNVYYERRNEPKGDGFGVDIYRDKVIYPDDFQNNYYSETDKFILSSNKRFGVAMYYITPLKHGFDLSFGVGFLHYYLQKSLLDLTNNLNVKPSTNWYLIFGVTKEVRVTERFHLEMNGKFRNVEKYSVFRGNSRITKFEPTMGIRYDINFKNE